MKMPDNWYSITNIQETDSPALLVYADRVKENVRIVRSMIDDPARLRPHVKTHKIPEIAALLIDAGIRKFKCATISEAEMLAEVGAEDVLLAYQPVAVKVTRFLALIRQYPRTTFSCLVDHPDALQSIAAAAEATQVTAAVYIDLNVGMNRTGVAPGPKALDLYALAFRLPAIRVRGLHAYDGHIHDTSLEVRRVQADEAFRLVEQVRDDLGRMSFPEPAIIVGGTPTFPIHAKRPGVECSPGTFIFWDRGYGDAYPEQKFLPAAVVLTRVISIPEPHLLCLDLGYKSVASEKTLDKRVYFLNAPDLRPVGHSEEHLVVEVAEESSFKPGDVLYGIPHHICPTVALYDSVAVVENGVIVGDWKVRARGRKINI